MPWHIEITPPALDSIRHYLPDAAAADEVRRFVEKHLAEHADLFFPIRWARCPDDCFIYSHAHLAHGRLETLQFLVNDADKSYGVLRIVWVELVIGEAMPTDDDL